MKRRTRYTKTQSGASIRLGKNFLKRFDAGNMIDRTQPATDLTHRVHVPLPNGLMKFRRVA